MPEDIYTALGKRIREERLKAGFTQEELGEIADIHYSFLGYIERGTKKASLNTIQKIAAGLDIPVSKLFDTFQSKTKRPNQPFTEQLLPLLRDKPRKDQQFIIQLVKTVVRKLDRNMKS